MTDRKYVAEKLISCSTSILCLLVPICISAAAFAAGPAVDATMADMARSAMLWLLLPAIVLLAAQVLVSLLVLSDRILAFELPAVILGGIVLYLTIGLPIWLLYWREVVW